MIKSDQSTFLAAFASEVRNARRDQGMSREELAEIAGVHVNTIGMLERGQRDLNSVHQTYILSALGFPGIGLDAEGLHLLPVSAGDQADVARLINVPAAAVVWGMGKDIRALRMACGLSLAEVADKAQVHRNTIWNCEHGLVCPTGYTWFRILQAMEVSLILPGRLVR